jgi:GNAT superfamily N-acetyltransferase
MLTEGIASAFKSTIVRMATHSKATPVVAKSAQLAGVSAPAGVERVVTLRDGGVVRLRPIRPDDETRLQSFFERLSPRTVYQRFFTTYRRLPAAWYREFANVDYARRFALVAEEVGVEGIRLRGVARWEPAEEAGALEIALVIEDAWQSRGLGSALFRLLIETARARGHERFCADVLAENDRMLRMLRVQTEIQQTSAEHGVVHVCFGPGTSAAVA